MKTGGRGTPDRQDSITEENQKGIDIENNNVTGQANQE